MFPQTPQKTRTRRLCKSMIIISFIFIFMILILILILITTNPCSQTTQILLPNFNLNYYKNTHKTPYPNPETTPTNISHIVFGIGGATKTWQTKKHYIESWWTPNVTRGFLFLDQAPIQYLPWPPTSPPVRVSSDHKGVPYTVRMARVVEETFREEKGGGVRWYVMADDDTVFLPENLVEVLNKYDHNGYYYVGMNSESIISNSLFSFGMGFGGAGFALSYPLVELLVKNFDGCLKKYQYYHGSDHILQSCLADLGVSLTQEKGFHQIDLHGDISGLLAAHPQAPFVSLHHLDAVEPLFPAMDRPQSLNHLMKAAKTDQSRLFQQSICYEHPKDWTFSLSWGYSLHIYEKIVPPSVLQVPLQTFGEWRKGAKPAFMVNTRGLSKDPCEIPHIFYFDSVVEPGGGGNPREVITSYVRKLPRKLPPCLASGNRSANYVEKILVISPVKRLEMEGKRRECCEIVQVDKANVTTIKLRPCMKDEIVV
ncbi:hypothetical protein L6452_42768 [Arctium lappa]|uniref:Uncharacterized protein n=1 Tax=Arctium lappa TaxID=4217 RepID=A0ACB8XJ48_ARCLA|nr:hypothetical protein L6452_42768 [Arctium lappa]